MYQILQDKLFPYVQENLESYLTTKYEEEETQADIAALRDLVRSHATQLLRFPVKLVQKCCNSKDKCTIYMIPLMNWRWTKA